MVEARRPALEFIWAPPKYYSRLINASDGGIHAVRMTLPTQLRTWHKQLGLLLGAQVLLWCVSGLYMASVDIDFIHGDSLVRHQQPALPRDRALTPIAAHLQRHSGVYGAKLRVLPDTNQLVYALSTVDGPVTVDAVSGAILSPLPQVRIETLARAYYAGEGAVLKAQLLDHVPVEIRGREPYLWRVDFDDWLNTTFYLDPDSGALITRRHRLWRIFDTFWMLHIMDYGYERDDVNNTLLRAASAIGVVFGATGVWLLFYSFRRVTRPR